MRERGWRGRSGFVVPAVAARGVPPPPPPPPPPRGGGGGGGGVGGSEPAPTALLHPDRLSRRSCPSVIPAQAGIYRAPSMVGGAGAASVGRRDIKARIEAEVA